MTEFATAFAAQIADAGKEASRSCGGVDTLYDERFHEEVDRLLNNLPDDLREEGLTIARQHGYVDDFEPYAPGPGECSLTGLDVSYCHCGRHE